MEEFISKIHKYMVLSIKTDNEGNHLTKKTVLLLQYKRVLFFFRTDTQLCVLNEQLCLVGINRPLYDYTDYRRETPTPAIVVEYFTLKIFVSIMHYVTNVVTI